MLRHWLTHPSACALRAARRTARGPQRVLVTNDDGVKAPGIDALVRELATPSRVSQGIGATVSYDAAAHYVGQLVERFRKSRGVRAKLTTRVGLRHALVANVNFPTSASGSSRGVRP